MDDEHKEEEDLSCGWRSFKPRFLQKLNTPKWFLVFLTIYSFMQGMTANGFTAAGLTALEKRFKLSSKQTGMIVAANDVSTLFLIIFISYYGGHRHKARWLGFGALVTSLGCLVFALPHVLIGKYLPVEFERSDSGGDLCHMNTNTNTTALPKGESCSNVVSNSDWKYMFVFIGAKLLLGAGTTPLFTLGPSYIDENVDPKSVPMYLGTWFIATFFGPGIGYVAGGSLLNIWVDLIQPPGMKITPDDPRWIGAWWLGYFFGGLLLLVSAIALLGYPREMPGAREIRARAIKEGLLPPRDDHIQGRLKDLIPATKALLTNGTFVCNTLALSATVLIATGLGPFISKFIQSQFGEPSSTAGILTGVIIIPGTAGGIFLGSYLVKRIELRNSCRTAAKYCFIFQFISTWGVLTFLIPGCKTSQIAGINAPYGNSSMMGPNMTTLCNVGCMCKSTEYFPVCGVDKISYFSSCYAGCQKKIGMEEFDLCRCIPPAVKGTKYGFAKKGVCDRDCKNLVPFLFGALVLLVANFMNATPNKTVVLRCVPDNQRTYALGLQWLFLSIFASVPGPVLFGTFIDKTCNLWEDSCGTRGSCLEYNNELLSYLLAACGLFFQVLSTLFYFGSWYCIKRREEREAAEEQRNNSRSELSSPVPGICGADSSSCTPVSTDPSRDVNTAISHDVELVQFRCIDSGWTGNPFIQHETSI